MALSSPLLDDVSIRGARGVLVNISGDERMSLHEVSQATAVISEEAGEDANVIFGAVVGDRDDDEMLVTVIATGFARREREIMPAFSAEAAPPHLFGPGERTEARGSADLDEYAVVGIGAGERRLYREPNIDIPTFLRKQLD